MTTNMTDRVTLAIPVTQVEPGDKLVGMFYALRAAAEICVEYAEPETDYSTRITFTLANEELPHAHMVSSYMVMDNDFGVMVVRNV